MSNAFQLKPGELTNRIPTPTDWSVDGSSVWCLGSAEAGWTARLAPGDTATVEQTASFDAALYLLARVRLRGPSVVPSGWSWEVYALRGAVEVWKRDVRAGLDVDVADVVLATFGQSSPMLLRLGLRLLGPGGAEPRDMELPAVFIADVTPVEDDPLLLGNAVPTHQEEAVPLTSTLTFDVVDPLGVTPLAASTRIWVGVEPATLVFDTGAQQLGGWVVSSTAPFTGVRRFTLTPPAQFGSEDEVQVEVESTSGVGRNLSTNFSFQAEDTTPPSVELVQGRAQRTVRVRFTEPMDSTAEEVDAYSLTRLSASAVDVQVQSVTRVSPTEVDLLLDIPATPRGLYRLVAQNVRDTSGNFIEAPDNAFEFQGFQPPVPAGRRFQLWDMVPQMNREEDETGDLRRFLSLLQEPLDLVLADVDRWTEILDVDLAEERYLDQMLYQLGNPFSFELSEENKRRLIRVLVPMYRQKGTSIGIVNTIRFFLGLEVEVRALAAPAQVWNLGEDMLGDETFLASSNRRMFYTFEVVSEVVLTEAQRERIRAVVDYMKVAHEHFVALVEPSSAPPVNHVELGLSELGVTFLLH